MRCQGQGTSPSHRVGAYYIRYINRFELSIRHRVRALLRWSAADFLDDVHDLLDGHVHVFVLNVLVQHDPHVRVVYLRYSHGRRPYLVQTVVVFDAVLHLRILLLLLIHQ